MVFEFGQMVDIERERERELPMNARTSYSLQFAPYGNIVGV